MSELKNQLRRLYALMDRANDYIEAERIPLRSSAWQRYRALERQAGDCSDAVQLTGLIDQAEAALSEAVNA